MSNGNCSNHAIPKSDGPRLALISGISYQRPEDFSHEHLLDNPRDPLNLKGVDLTTPLFFMQTILTALNTYRQKFLETGSEINQCHFNELEKREELVKRQKQYWWQMIQLLPSSYNQKRTVMLNYEVLSNIYQHRRNHKLDEWRGLCRWIEGLPYSEIVTCNVTFLPGRAKKEQLRLFADDTDKTPVHGGIFDIPAVMTDGTKNY